MSTSLQFGLVMRERTSIAESAHAIEAAGFDYIVAGEHVLFYGETTSGLLQLAAAAAATNSVRLLSGVVLAPLYPAVMLAWLAMSLDHISHGRFELGLGVGGEFPKEFEALGVDIRERGARTDEALQVMHRLWNDDLVTFDGRFTKFDGVRLHPKPVQACLPIWVAGRKVAAMRRAGRYADGWLPYMYSPERLAASVTSVREEAERAGRDPTSVRIGIYAFSSVHEDAGVARRMAGEAVSGSYHQDLRHLVDRYFIAGTPAQCVARIREYAEAGAELVVLSPTGPPAQAAGMLSLLEGEVLSKFKRTPRAHTTPAAISSARRPRSRPSSSQ